MFKKLLLCLSLAMFAVAAQAQTIVSTSPQDKNVVLEEFTGIHCVFCPSGHAIAQAIQDAHPDRVSLINIHQGYYANPSGGEPDFRTTYGDAIVNQSYSGSEFGYPSGTVNRHVFPGRSMATGGGSAMSRSYWTVSANETLALPSPVNVGVEATIDVQTRILTVHVEAYYTSNSPQSSNLLNVALLQNNTKGPQTGGGKGNQYNHMHRLVELITGQWGESINTTTAGSFVNKTYTYTIPADYRGVPAMLEDMEIVAFVTETHQEIPTGSRALPTYTGITNTNDAHVRSIEDIDPMCKTDLAPVINIKNEGSDTLTSLEITYAINGESHTYNWTGNITALQNEDIELPSVPFTLQATNTVTVSVPNDQNNSNNSATTEFDEAQEATGQINIIIQTDPYPSEFRWELKNSNGTVVESGRNYPGTTTTTVTLELTEDCYTFIAYDSYGDGGTRVTIQDSEGTQLFRILGNWGDKQSVQFSSNGVLGVNQNEIGNINIYPNPTRDILNISNAENANIQVYDLLGKLILSKENLSVNEELNVSSLQAGAYFLKISREGNVTTKKFIIAK